jgi:hypothetical protein
MEKLLAELKLKAANCGDSTKESRARKGAYVDCIMMIKEALKISSNPVLVDSLPCSHMYSRSMNQPYPRKCVKCGEVEKANFH